jgi:signal recognition particle subunit SRP54
MGDVLTLIEKAQSEMDQEEAAKAGAKLMKGEFNLDDFLKQMQQIRKLGPIAQLLEMVPGMSKMTKDVDMSTAEQDIKRIEAIIQSMTMQERRDPKILKASRKRRIAAGSGTTVQDVNVLLKQFRDMQTMMKQLGKNRGRGLANLFGGRFPGM